MQTEIIAEGCSNMDALLYRKTIEKEICGLLLRESQIEITDELEIEQYDAAHRVYDSGCPRNQVERGSIFFRLGVDSRRAQSLLNGLVQEFASYN